MDHTGSAISRDKKSYYVSLAHGRPFGSVWKYSTKDDRVLGRVTLGLFPATMDLNADGSLLYVVNFNLHGDMVPSSVSVVATEPMLEVARIPTCTMPHGSRLNPQGTKHYSACMMDDMLVEIDTQTLKVSRHFLLTKGREHGNERRDRILSLHRSQQRRRHQLWARMQARTRAAMEWSRRKPATIPVHPPGPSHQRPVRPFSLPAISRARSSKWTPQVERDATNSGATRAFTIWRSQKTGRACSQPTNAISR